VYPKPVFDVIGPAVTKMISDNRTALAFDHAPKLADNRAVIIRKGAGR
jgi:hypothetical protein